MTPQEARLDPENIQHFEFTAWIPPVVKVNDRQALTSLARHAYAKTLDVLNGTRFKYQERLELEIYDSGFELNYDDADFGFRLGLIDDRIVLRRSGCSLRRFDVWYRELMPSVSGLVDSLLQEAESLFAWPGLRVLKCALSFQLIAFEFQPVVDVPGRQPTRNTSLLTRLISRVPDADGSLEDPLATPKGLGRVDYAVSRWTSLERGLVVREIYSVEAPANRTYSALWLRHSIVGETQEAGDVAETGGDPDELDRREFEFDVYFAQNGIDLLDDLFNRKFLGSFVPALLMGFKYQTALGPLP